MLSKNQAKEIQFLHAKKFRDKEKKFIVEGVKTVLELINEKPILIDKLFCTQEFFDDNGPLIFKNKLPSQIISTIELKKISLQESPNEALAICNYFNNSFFDFDFEKKFSIYLDDIRDPGNFGTIIRLANWFGIKTIFASPQSCEIYNPKVIQSSMGAFLRVDVNYIELENLIRQNKIKNVFGAVLNGKSIYKTEIKNGIIIIGNEANGISEINLKSINHFISIPSSSSNGSESLNAAMAASIIVSEVFRKSLK